MATNDGLDDAVTHNADIGAVSDVDVTIRGNGQTYEEKGEVADGVLRGDEDLRNCSKVFTVKLGIHITTMRVLGGLSPSACVLHHWDTEPQ